MSSTAGWLLAGAMCLGSSIASPVAVASAQRAADATPELIDAILRQAYRFEGGNVRLLNGRVPEDLADFSVPPGTRVLGSVVSGSSVRVFATTRAPLDSLREFYTRALAPAGWKPFSWGIRGGFVEARRDMPVMFCRDGAQLQIQRLPGAGGTSDLVLDYRDGMGPCDQPPGLATATSSVTATATATASRSFMRAEPLRFPTLHAPEDASGSARSRCYSRAGGQRGGASMGTVVAANMTAAELLRHYASQLESAGWRAFSPDSREAAIGTWTLADTSGVREVTLQVVESSRPAPACFDVQMRMSERPR